MNNSLTDYESKFTHAERAFEKLLKLAENSQNQQRPLHELEQELVPLLMQIGLATLRDFVVNAGDGDLGEEIDVEGQILKRSKKKTSCNYRSVFGLLKVERYTYVKREKTKAIFKPVDQKLGLPADDISYVLENWLGQLSVDVPFETATAFLKNTLGIDAYASMAHRRIEKLGQYVEAFNEQRESVCPEEEQEILVALADGKGLPVRTSFEQRRFDELGIKPTQRPKPQKDYEKSKYRHVLGDKKTQRATVGAFYSVAPDRRNPQTVLDGESSEAKPTNKRLWAEMNLIADDEVSRGADRIFEALREERHQRDPNKKKKLVCLMDGDRFLWSHCASYLPGAIEILDLYHTMEYLWQAAHCFHPEASVDAEKWVGRHLKMLLEDKVDSVRGLFRRELNKGSLNKTKAKHLETVYRYFTKNRCRMQYGTYIRQGYPIGSGVIEGACKHVVGDRMCCTGMSWEYEGAQPMLDLRVTKLNGEWEALIKYRIKAEQNKLYATAA